MIVLSAVNSKLLFEIKKRVKFMRSIEIFVIFTVRTLYLAIVTWGERPDELVPNAEFCQLLLEQMRSGFVRCELLRKLRAVVSLDTKNLKWSGFDQMLQKDGRRVRAVLLKGFQIAPAGELVDCCVLVELLSFCISNDADLWHELHINLNSFARKVHLFVRFWNIFRVWLFFSHLTLTAQDTIKSGDRALVAASAQLYPEYNQTGMRISSAEVCDLAQFSFRMLVRVVMGPVRSVGKKLDVAVISALPTVDILAVHIVLDGGFRYTVLLSVVQKRLTKPHSLCYSIHDECVALSVVSFV